MGAIRHLNIYLSGLSTPWLRPVAVVFLEVAAGAEVRYVKRMSKSERVAGAHRWPLRRGDAGHDHTRTTEPAEADARRDGAAEEESEKQHERSTS